jgi:hypothetical protein
MWYRDRMPPLDPRADFADDGGTPGWRVRHAPQITVYRTRREESRAYLRQHPIAYFQFGLIAAIGLYLFFLVEIAGFLIYALISRLLWGE